MVATKGAMVAYQGRMTFRHEGSGSIGKLMKKVLTNEDAPMMRVSGEGEVFFARQALHVFTVLLEGEAITERNLIASALNIAGFALFTLAAFAFPFFAFPFAFASPRPAFFPDVFTAVFPASVFIPRAFSFSRSRVHISQYHSSSSGIALRMLMQRS